MRNNFCQSSQTFLDSLRTLSLGMPVLYFLAPSARGIWSLCAFTWSCKARLFSPRKPPACFLLLSIQMCAFPSKPTARVVFWVLSPSTKSHTCPSEVCTGSQSHGVCVCLCMCVYHITCRGCLWASWGDPSTWCPSILTAGFLMFPQSVS